MKKIKILVTCALAVGVIAASSLTSLAAITKVTYNLYYTGTSVGSVLYRESTISANSKKYYAKCTDSYNKGQIQIHVPGATDYTLDKNQSHNFTRSSSSSGNMTVSGSLIRSSSGSCSVAGYVEKK